MNALTECTSPSAPFYNADLIALSFAEAFGVDLPCTAMIALGTGGIGLALFTPVVCFALALKYVRT